MRGRVLIEESRELVVVLDEEDRVLAASRRAREALEGLEEGQPFPRALLEGEDVLEAPYEVDRRRERIVYLRSGGDAAAYQELRAGFTASVSHELRTPLARLLALLEQARAEVDQIRELIDDVLFLSELETGRAVVGLGATPGRPVLDEVAADLEERAARAAVTLRVEGDATVELPLRPRMLRVIAQNLAENAIRYAGPGAAFTLSA